MSQFEGKHVVVTGGAGGLGGGVVNALLAEGATVHVPAFEDEAPAHLASLSGCDVVTSVNLVDESAVAGYYDSLPSLWASIHVAGGFAMAPALDTALADFRKMLEMNVVTCFLSSREAARKMRASGQGGRIVNVAAGPAVKPTAGMIAYATAKSAVAAMTEHLALELKGDSIFVNAVLPSIIDTPANRAAMPDADHALWPTPAELAATMVQLASPANTLTWGALVPVYGRA